VKEEDVITGLVYLEFTRSIFDGYGMNLESVNGEDFEAMIGSFLS
jgi:hypothetical protein